MYTYALGHFGKVKIGQQQTEGKARGGGVMGMEMNTYTCTSMRKNFSTRRLLSVSAN